MASSTADAPAPKHRASAIEVARQFMEEHRTYQTGFSGEEEVRIHAPMFTRTDIEKLHGLGWRIGRITDSTVSVIKVVARPDDDAILVYPDGGSD